MGSESGIGEIWIIGNSLGNARVWRGGATGNHCFIVRNDR